jgi:ABC-2 type transport system ATP-binding protein
VLTGLSLQVPRGQVVGLLGPSGCGKSTLMRAVVGVQRTAGGRVTVLGHPAGSRQLRRRVGYVTQAPSVYDDLTVQENLRFFARVLGVDRGEVLRCLDAVDLGSARDRVVGRLSGGQRSRVSLAVALLGKPELLVLDEPTVGLDPVLRRDLWAMFHALADAGTAVIVSSHVMDEAERCDRLLLMRAGRLLAEDTPQALLERTRTDDVEAAFLALVDGAGVAA